MNIGRGRAASCLLALAAAAGARADDADPAGTASPSRPGPGDLLWTVNTSGHHRFEADIDDGAAFSLTQGRIGLSATLVLAERTQLTTTVEYARSAYDFTDNARFGGADPWSDINELRAVLMLDHQFDDRWGVFGLAHISSTAEDQADEADAVTGGGALGLEYTFSPSLTIGAGLLGTTRIEDDPHVLPIVRLEWRTNERTTIRGGYIPIATTLGQGLDVTWSLDDNWEVGGGVRYRNMRFRLDDEDIAPDGVGEDESIPVYARVTWRHGRSSVSVFGGAAFGGTIQLETSHGRELVDEGYDPAPFVGLGAVIRF